MRVCVCVLGLLGCRPIDTYSFDLCVLQSPRYVQLSPRLHVSTHVLLCVAAADERAYCRSQRGLYLGTGPVWIINTFAGLHELMNQQSRFEIDCCAQARTVTRHICAVQTTASLSCYILCLYHNPGLTRTAHKGQRSRHCCPLVAVSQTQVTLS